jgi:hypothetical protein
VASVGDNENPLLFIRLDIQRPSHRIDVPFGRHNENVVWGSLTSIRPKCQNANKKNTYQGHDCTILRARKASLFAQDIRIADYYFCTIVQSRPSLLLVLFLRLSRVVNLGYRFVGLFDEAEIQEIFEV